MSGGAVLGFLAAAALAAAPSPRRFPRRGVMEGFYGRPWTWAQRRDMVAWIGAHHGNLFVIAPKDEALQRRLWRKPLGPSYLRDLRALAGYARRRGVDLAWELSPGVDFRAGRADEDAAVQKLESVADCGVRRLILAFDDTPARLSQVEFANAVLGRLLAARPGLELTFVPALYWGQAAGTPYLDHVARALDSRFRVGWTGPQVLSRAITARDGASFRAYMRHGLVLGDNYPVQDRVEDAGPLFLGPVRGRQPGLAQSQDAYLANASPLEEASKIPLASQLAYAWNPAGYDPDAFWSRQLAAARKRSAGEAAFLAAAERSWLDLPQTAPMALSAAGFSPFLRGLLLAPEAFADRPALRRELAPWLERAREEAQAVLKPRRGRPATSENPAVVAGFAIDALAQGRLPLGDAARQAFSAGARGRLELDRALRLLASADAAANVGSRRAWGEELSPWSWILAEDARRARAALGGSWISGSSWESLAWRWRARAALLPLLACRRMMDGYLEDPANAKTAAADLPWLLRAAVWRERRRFGRASFAAGLQDELAAGDAAALGRRFEAMIAWARELRRPGVPQAAWPWLFKVEDYGRAGLLALKRRKGRWSAAEEADWRRLGRRLRSGNGLEEAVELKLLLDGLARWGRDPGRPFVLPWPAQPQDAL